MNDIFENTETMKENEHPRFYTAESVMRGHPDKLCDLIADSVLDACLQHDPASRVACEVMATHGHIIVAGEITTSAKPDVFNIVRDTLRDVGYKTNPDRPHIQQVNTALKQLRQEEHLCRKIAEQSLEVQQHLTEARRDRAAQQQREQEHERDRLPNIDLTL